MSDSNRVYNDEKPTSMIFDHCVTVYNAMRERSQEEETTVEINDGAANVTELWTVYEGHTTQLFQQLRLSTPYYTAIMSALKQMGCVEQLRRGGGKSMSRWRLLKEPEENAYREMDWAMHPQKGRLAQLEQHQRDLARRLSTVERALGLLEKAS